MKKKLFSLITITTLIFTSCTNIMDKPLNKKDFEKVKTEVLADKNYSSMKSRYLIDNLTKQLGFIELGETMGKALGKDMDELKISTFREEISNLSVAFDSIHTAKIKIIENNTKLENFTKLIDASTTSIDKYKGYLSMKLNFKNNFKKEILYIILNYKYVNKYDSEFFNEKTKLTDEVAGNFNGELEISTTEKYNDVAEFMYTKVPVRADKLLRDKLGKDIADKQVEQEFLMKGLKVETLGIVFKDKSQISKEDAVWGYLEN